jgi:hypothetical protein
MSPLNNSQGFSLRGERLRHQKGEELKISNKLLLSLELMGVETDRIPEALCHSLLFVFLIFLVGSRVITFACA